MNDLFKGLIKAARNRKYFYGDYEDLNSVEIPTEAEMFRIQLNNLKDLERSASLKYQSVNEFLSRANERLPQAEEMEEEITNDLYARIIQLLNTGLWANQEANPTRRQALGLINKSQKLEEIDAILTETASVLAKMDLSEGVSSRILDGLALRLKKQSGADNKAYTNLKADYAEQLMVEALNKNEGWRALQTGNFVDELGQQLIEDVMTFSKSSGSFKQGALSFKVNRQGSKGGVTLHAKSVGELFAKIEKLNGSNFTIQLSNPLYDALKEASILNAQVKSGMNSQAILTRSARNSISLGETGFCCGRLEDLYNLVTPNPWFKEPSEQNSKDLEALANYSLSQAIVMTNLNRNQLYYTEHGFMTASQWMEDNMFMLKFNPGVTSMTPEFRTMQRRYQLMKARA